MTALVNAQEPYTLLANTLPVTTPDSVWVYDGWTWRGGLPGEAPPPGTPGQYNFTPPKLPEQHGHRKPGQRRMKPAREGRDQGTLRAHRPKVEWAAILGSKARAPGPAAGRSRIDSPGA